MASLNRAISAVGFFTLISRISGFARDLLVARLFGADALTDAFFVAFKIPNFFRRLFAEGSFSVAFVPVLSEYRTQRSFEELRLFIAHISGTLGVVLIGVSLAGSLGAPLMVALFAPGFLDQPQLCSLTGQMLRLTFPYLLFISLTAFYSGILNSHHRFAIPAFTPVLLNVCLIASALWLTPYLDAPIMALAWGVLVAGILQWLFQMPWVLRLGLLTWPKPTFRDPGVMQVMKLMVPALFGVSVTQINLLVDTLIASFLVSGSISWLYYSDRLMEFPLGVLGVALGTVILPNLSLRHAEQDHQAFSSTLDWALRWTALLGLPAAAGLILLAEPLMATCFHSAHFDDQDVHMAALSLMAFGMGLAPFMAIKVLAPGFYARQDTRTPMRFGMIAMAVNLILNLSLAYPFGHVGLASATSTAALVNAGLLLRRLLTLEVYQPPAHWRWLGWRIALALAGMILVLILGQNQIIWLEAPSALRILALSLLIVGGGACYVGLLLAFGVRPRHLLR